MNSRYLSLSWSVISQISFLNTDILSFITRVLSRRGLWVTESSLMTKVKGMMGDVVTCLKYRAADSSDVSIWALNQVADSHLKKNK